MVQVAIAAGESFFPSKARIVVAVAAEVENSRLVALMLTLFAILDTRLMSRSVLCEDG